MPVTGEISRRTPEDKPIEPDKIPEDKKSELNELEKKILEKVDKQDIKNSLIDFFNSSVDITIVSVKDMVKSKEDLDKIKKALKVSFDHVAKKYINKNKQFDVSTFKSDFGLNQGGGLKLPKEISDNIEVSNVDNTANDILSNMGSALAKIAENYSPGIKRQLYDSSAPSFTEGSTQDDINHSESYTDTVADTITPEQKRRYKDDKTKAEIKEITDPNGDPTKNESRWTLKDIVKFAGLLISAFKFVSLLLILINYALSHSGCMRYSCGEGDTVPIGYKAFCYAPPGDTPAFQKILNPTSGVLDFSSDRCTCNLNDQGSKTCGSSTCEYPTTNKLAPYFNGCPSSNFKCKSDPNKGCPVTYYSFRLFNPMQLFPDAADTVSNKGPKFLQEIIKVAIIIGIILGVLLVLWIIYKVVANRKPAETLKIETPSTVTKFGNRGYLGNLSKYSNYAYMGRCVAHPAIPYIPPRFKF